MGFRWPCKIGTMPMLVYLHGRDANLLQARTMQTGHRIRFRLHPTQRWETGIVNRIDPDRYFQADRM